jgi:diguanylate cyclase (GGDEF)-like protein/PAS domain S-box-containing protein
MIDPAFSGQSTTPTFGALEAAITRCSADGLVVVDAEGVVRYANPSVERLLAVEQGEAVGLHAFDLVHPDDQLSALEGFESTLAASDSRPLPLLIRLRRTDGSWVQTEIIGTHHLNVPTIRGLLLNIRDVTRSMRTDAALRHSEEQHRLIVELAREGIWMIDAEARTTFANRALADMLDTSVTEMLGTSMFDYMDDDPHVETVGRRQRAAANEGEEHDVRLLTKRGRTVWVRINTSPIIEHGGAYRGAIAMVTDITERRALEQSLAVAARRDPLTCVANRSELFDALNAKLTAGFLVTALFIDLDDFKHVNDTYGHGTGDELLRAVAGRICGAVRSTDVVARVGGDEFVVISDVLEGPSDAINLGYRICDALARPFGLGAVHLEISASIGAAFARHGDADKLLADADQALYKAKRAGRGRIELGNMVATRD